MAYEIALVNPRVKNVAKRKKRAKRRMTAKQLKYFGPRRKTSKRRSTARVAEVATKKRRRRAKRKSTAVVAHSPKRRRRSHAVVKRRASRRRTNPRFMNGPVGDAVGMLIPASIGAAGVIAVDRVLGFLPIANISSNPDTQRHINRAMRVVGAAGVGVLAQKFMGREKGRAVGAAAMGVALHGLISQFIPGAGTGLGEYMGDDDMSGMGEYMGDDDLSGDDPAPLLSGSLDGSLDGDALNGDDFAFSGMGEYMGDDDT